MSYLSTINDFGASEIDLLEAFEFGSQADRVALAKKQPNFDSILESLSKLDDIEIKTAVAQNIFSPSHVIEELAKDKDALVAQTAQVNIVHEFLPEHIKEENHAHLIDRNDFDSSVVKITGKFNASCSRLNDPVLNIEEVHANEVQVKQFLASTISDFSEFEKLTSNIDKLYQQRKNEINRTGPPVSSSEYLSPANLQPVEGLDFTKLQEILSDGHSTLADVATEISSLTMNFELPNSKEDVIAVLGEEFFQEVMNEITSSNDLQNNNSRER